MGKKVLAFSTLPKLSPEVFSPVNYRPTENCRTLVFDPSDGNGYDKQFDAQGIQYALGERMPDGYHVIETPDADGPLLRYTSRLSLGRVLVKRHKSESVGCVYNFGEVQILGFVFQFIKNFETGERWEFIRGPAHEGEGEALTRPLYEVSG